MLLMDLAAKYRLNPIKKPMPEAYTLLETEFEPDALATSETSPLMNILAELKKISTLI